MRQLTAGTNWAAINDPMAEDNPDCDVQQHESMSVDVRSYTAKFGLGINLWRRLFTAANDYRIACPPVIHCWHLSGGNFCFNHGAGGVNLAVYAVFRRCNRYGIPRKFDVFAGLAQIASSCSSAGARPITQRSVAHCTRRSAWIFFARPLLRWSDCYNPWW